jgi:hypothetical protein
MDERLAKLLLKGVRALPLREQDQVLTALLRTVLAEPETVTHAAPPVPPELMMLSGGPMPPPGGGAPGPAAMLPVRLPPELHERLRRWSTDNGFSMASVVRGLVERFLDEQGRAGRTPRSAKPAGGRTRPSPGTRSKPKRPTARG